MIPAAEVEVAGTIAGALAPVIGLITLVALKALFKDNRVVERAVTEVEGEIKREIQNGIQDRLDDLTAKVNVLMDEVIHKKGGNPESKVPLEGSASSFAEASAKEKE